ncbi:protein of unknown function [Cyanobium sp. NIES-981]|nr:protein of unknown function [Cyanobium sp. NIES-981]
MDHDEALERISSRIHHTLHYRRRE